MSPFWILFFQAAPPCWRQREPREPVGRGDAGAALLLLLPRPHPTCPPLLNRPAAPLPPLPPPQKVDPTTLNRQGNDTGTQYR